MSERMPVLFAAQAISLSARTNVLTRHAVDDMRERAEQLLPEGDELRRAILTFATQYEILHRDTYGLKVLGEALQRDVDVAMGASPPARKRRDIDD